LATTKADVELLFGVQGGGRVSSGSGALIKEQLSSIVLALNSDNQVKQRRIKLSLDIQGTKTAFNTELKNLVNGLSGQKNLSIKIPRIDVTQAVSQVKKDLQAMLSSLSVSNGVNLSGLKDFVGFDINEIKNAKINTQAYAEQIKTLDSSIRNLSSSYKTLISSNSLSNNTLPTVAITNSYNLLEQKFADIKASGKKLSEENVKIFQKEVLGLQTLIDKTQKKSDIENANVAAAKELSEIRSRASLKAASAEEQIANAARRRAEIEAASSETARLALTKKYASELELGEKAEAAIRKKASVEEVANAKTLSSLKAKQDAEAAAAARKEAYDNRTINDMRQVVALYKQIDTYLNRNTRAVGTDQYTELQGLRDSIAPGKLDTTLKVTGLEAMKVRFAELTAGIRLAGKEGQSFGGVLGGIGQKLLTWFSGMRMITTIVRLFKNMYNSVKEIDTAMTELKKVTDETNATYSRFLINASDRARTLGASLKDIVNATADFARLGFDVGEASMLADVAILYNNVGDGLSGVEEATSSIISTMKAFGIEANNAIDIVDKFNIVGNSFAVSSGSIGQALTRSASAMAAGGNSLEETIALFTAGAEITQNAETAGTAMRTLSMYFRGAKVEAEEAGEATDGMAESTSKLREKILALTGQKVDIQLDETSFKSMYEVYRELSEVYDDMTDISQAALLELLGGKRTANMTSAMLKNFGTAERVMQTMSNSAGSATAENEKFLDSIQGKLNVFSASFQALSNTFLNSDMLKGFIEGATTALDVLNSVAKTLGTFPTLLTAVVGGITAVKAAQGKSLGVFDFSNQNSYISRALQAQDSGGGLLSGSIARNKSLFPDISKTNTQLENYNEIMQMSRAEQHLFFESIAESEAPMDMYFKSLGRGQADLKGYANYCKNAGIQTQELGETAKTASVGVKILSVAANMIVSMAIGLAINALIGVISAWINKAKEEREVLIEAGKAAKEHADSLLELYEAYIRINEAYELGNESKLNFIVSENKLIKNLKLTGDEIDELIIKYGSLKKALEETFEEQTRSDIVKSSTGINAQIEQSVKDMKGFVNIAVDDEFASFLSGKGYGLTTILTGGAGPGAAQNTSSALQLPGEHTSSSIMGYNLPTYEGLIENEK